MSVPCGGCGAKEDRERCMGCFHDFGTPESAWVHKYTRPARRSADTPTQVNGGDR